MQKILIYNVLWAERKIIAEFFSEMWSRSQKIPPKGGTEGYKRSVLGRFLQILMIVELQPLQANHGDNVVDFALLNPLIRLLAADNVN